MGDPYAGTWRGHDEVTRWLETVYASVDVNVFEPQEMISARDKVVTTGRLHLVAKSTGRDIRSDFVHVVTVTDGKWSRFRDFMDTAVAVAGVRLTVPAASIASAIRPAPPRSGSERGSRWCAASLSW